MLILERHPRPLYCIGFQPDDTDDQRNFHAGIVNIIKGTTQREEMRAPYVVVSVGLINPLYIKSVKQNT